MMMTKSLLVVGSALVATCTSLAAFACSPPLDPPRIEVVRTGTPTAVAYRLDGDVFDLGHATLTGTAGEVEGTLEQSAMLDRLVLFRPAEPLAAGDYELRVVVDGDFEPVEATETVTVVDELSLAELDVELAATHREDWTDIVCCSTAEGGCFDSCGECMACWPAGYEYTRQIDVTIASAAPRILSITMDPTEEGDTRVAVVGALDGAAGAQISGGALESDRICVVVVEFDIEGQQLGESEHCLGADDFPALEQREPDFPDRVAQCEEPPDDTNDPNWQRYGVLPGMNDDERDPARGCSTAHGSPIVALLLAIAVIGLRRRP